MRGKRRVGAESSYHIRIIPAHAGQTRVRIRARFRYSDHPRACGANVGRQIIATRLDGSSPRMRGKRCIICVLNSALRIIPAHAGQTNTDNTNTSVNADHPRACGANGIGRTRLEYPQGSSPRMRGKLGVAQRRERVFRIIPAHAGQTSPSPLWGAPCPDHPRACGANAPTVNSAAGSFGSSPRMRGKLPWGTQQ